MRPLYNYGLSQEDALTEYRALDIERGDRLIAIASGGEIPLNLIALEDLSVEAVDISRGQLSLARLKLAACRALEPAEAASFLGFTGAPAASRRRLFDRVAFFLAEDERRFWRASMSAIERGAIRAGRFETYLRKFSRFVLFVLGEKRLRGLFERDTFVERQDYFDRFLSTAMVKALFRVAFDPRLYRRRGIADEGLTHSGERDIPGFFYGRFRDFCCATPARKNYYLQFVLWGRILFPEALPEYLSPEGLARVRRRHGNIAWREASIEKALAQDPAGTFNKFHLSNIGDWMSRERYAGLLTHLCDRAAPASRAVARYIHLDHPLPGTLSGRLVRDARLAEELIKADRFPFYNLVIMEMR
jgi:S-adenosylmethionine-diacylglycerol 3-amino-3-carboxypropyl transferase